MKKLLAITLAGLMLLFCACSRTTLPETGNGGAQAVNPISESSLEDLAKYLGLEKINLADKYKVNKVSKINAEDIIYDIELAVDSTTYNVRIAKKSDKLEADISGLYLTGKISSAVYDSADEVAPSVSVDISSDGAKAYGEWKDCYFSVSTEKSTLDDMQKITVEIMNEIF